MYVRSTKLEKTSLSFANGLSANGDGEIRTLDPLLARQVLSQLSYTPIYREIFSQNQTMLRMCSTHAVTSVTHAP